MLLVLLASSAFIAEGREDDDRGGADTIAADRVRSAIEAAVRARLGPAGTVTVTLAPGLRVLERGRPLVALPDPSARIGKPSHFVLSDQTPGKPPARVGEATATVDVTAEVVVTRKIVPRGSQLGRDDVVLRTMSLEGWAMRPLPGLDDTVGAKAARDLGADAVVTRADIAPLLLIRAGDAVRARLQIADVELTGKLVAAENGRRNEIIRVVNPESRHVLRARVVGSAEVEVVNVR